MLQIVLEKLATFDDWMVPPETRQKMQLAERRNAIDTAVRALGEMQDANIQVIVQQLRQLS